MTRDGLPDTLVFFLAYRSDDPDDIAYMGVIDVPHHPCTQEEYDAEVAATRSHYEHNRYVARYHETTYRREPSAA